MRLIAAALIAGLALPPVASGQGGAALKGAELEAALAGKAVRVRTPKIVVGDPANPTGVTVRTDGGHSVIDMTFRPDHSATFRCTNVNRSGESNPCRRTGGAGSGDAGVWAVKADVLCYQWLTGRGSKEQCYAVTRAGADFLLRQVSGPPSTVDGERLVPR